jgi:hypothetical protein
VLKKETTTSACLRHKIFLEVSPEHLARKVQAIFATGQNLVKEEKVAPK